MRYLKTYNQLFKSDTNITQENLYHLLDIDNLRYVIETDTLTSYQAGGGKISTTRNFMLNNYLGDNSTT